MGQRGVSAEQPSAAACVTVFRSRLGWLGLVARDRAVVAVSLGQPDAAAVWQSLIDRQELPRSWSATDLSRVQSVETWITDADGLPRRVESSTPTQQSQPADRPGPVTAATASGQAERSLSAELKLLVKARQLLSDYAIGEAVDLTSVPIRWSDSSEFRNRVYAVTRAIPRGELLTYGEIARRVGSPGAARAVGRAMATNRLPLLIPCHRVVGGSGKLTGFTAPEGISLKQHLLDLEAPPDRPVAPPDRPVRVERRRSRTAAVS